MIALQTALLADLGRVDSRADELTGVQVDSRRIRPGDLFVAVGRGSEFLSDALEGGAAATLVPDDAFAALAEIGRTVRDRSTARVVGITGSMGKTSTKDILAALCEIARPEIGVITNIGPVHLELVDSLDGVRRAKRELVDALPPGGTAVIPPDFPIERDDIDVVRVASPTATPRDGRTEIGGVSFNFTARHQAQNAATALAALDALGLPRPARVDVDFSRWRGEEDELPGGGLLINDAYNANPVSMRAALAYLADRAGDRRRVAILGDMAELGRTAPAYHREVGEAAAEAGVDELLAVGELARGYLEAGVPGRWFPNVHEAVRAVGDVVRPGDAVLVKASRAVGLEAVAAALTELTTA